MLQTGRQYLDLAVFFVCFCGSVYSNKYVLTSLHFTYPTIFQGWQTLFGLVFIKLVTLCSKQERLYGLDKPGFLSLLPNFLFFTGSVVAGSKALADISVPIFLAVQNVTAALVYILDHAPRFKGASAVSLLGSAFLVITAALIVLLDLDMTFKDSPYFWLMTHIVCSSVQTLHGRVADARYSDIDRLYYSYLVSVIVLAPSSLYLEEAFLVLDFPYKSQADFLAGCLVSGISAVLLAIFSIHVQEVRCAASVHGAARSLAALGSVFLFSDTKMAPAVAILVVINMCASLLVAWLPRQTLQLPTEKRPPPVISRDDAEQGKPLIEASDDEK
ncbi:transmembrane protein 241-like isoform X2 [Amphibalanus amphitrite]|uniref:transmembrane protein 241-like isoform X2 n=1 Tax=Amphibalanus amphitrite TaxID=1232801 RepID=UPI001C925093|nr:transmembrane protein 241-like isoform X2 [Amphibalanus amphitrite]XP_043227298.1 transmembrane protein 241-like isoform X2 [Amphibalanus amphitrite]